MRPIIHKLIDDIQASYNKQKKYKSQFDGRRLFVVRSSSRSGRFVFFLLLLLLLRKLSAGNDINVLYGEVV